MNEVLKETLENKIDYAIQCELSYQKDNITSEGWNFLEEKAPALVMAKLTKSCDDDENELSELTHEDVVAALTEIITEYEQTHANIRYFE